MRDTKENKDHAIATRKDWNITAMPEKTETFLLERTFSEDQIAALRRGHIPEEMEDKWFWFMEGNTLYAHRSWTGCCIYRIDFSFDKNTHLVTVNNDPEQVGNNNLQEMKNRLNDLLNWWTQPEYDGYEEWLHELLDMFQKAGVNPKGKEGEDEDDLFAEEKQ